MPGVEALYLVVVQCLTFCLLWGAKMDIIQAGRCSSAEPHPSPLEPPNCFLHRTQAFVTCLAVTLWSPDLGKACEKLSHFPTCKQSGNYSLNHQPELRRCTENRSSERTAQGSPLSCPIWTTAHLNSRSCPKNGAGSDPPGTGLLDPPPRQLCDSREPRRSQPEGKHGCGYQALTLSSISGYIWKSFHSWVSQFLSVSGNNTYFVWILRKMLCI